MRIPPTCPGFRGAVPLVRRRRRATYDSRIKGHSYPQAWYEDAVGEILNQATTGQSFSGNATPLMMGAIAYVVLFIPVVAFGRFLETRFRWSRV